MVRPKKKVEVRGASSGVVDIITKDSAEEVQSKKRKVPPSIFAAKNAFGQGGFGMGGASAW